MRQLFIIFLLFLFIGNCYSQHFTKRKPYSWMIGVDWNIMDDDGYRYTHLLDVKNSWNMPVFPSSVNVDIYLLKGMSIDAIASYNEYKLGKTINLDTNKFGKAAALDVHFKYSFGFLMTQQIFDPFIYAGVGYTGREAVWTQSMISGNIGAGFNIMIYGGFGVQWRTTGKISLFPKLYDVEYDYLHHHFGIIYKFAAQTNSQRRQNNFRKKKHRWIFKRGRYKKPRGM